jgi:hypothetical protein
MDDLNSVTPQELAACIQNISIKSKAHLKTWLEQSGRRWLIFDSLALVDSLTFPEGVDQLITMVAAYEQHRQALPTGEMVEEIDPTLGKPVQVPQMKSGVLSVEEMDRVVRFLIRSITEVDPTWVL